MTGPPHPAYVMAVASGAAVTAFIGTSLALVGRYVIKQELERQGIGTTLPEDEEGIFP